MAEKSCLAAFFLCFVEQPLQAAFYVFPVAVGQEDLSPFRFQDSVKRAYPAVHVSFDGEDIGPQLGFQCQGVFFVVSQMNDAVKVSGLLVKPGSPIGFAVGIAEDQIFHR